MASGLNIFAKGMFEVSNAEVPVSYHWSTMNRLPAALTLYSAALHG